LSAFQAAALPTVSYTDEQYEQLFNAVINDPLDETSSDGDATTEEKRSSGEDLNSEEKRSSGEDLNSEEETSADEGRTSMEKTSSGDLISEEGTDIGETGIPSAPVSFVSFL